MRRKRAAFLEERRRLRAEYGTLFDSLTALLCRHDPVHIACEDVNPDEYNMEASTILPRLKRCHSVNDVMQVVHEEFVRWFDEPTAGPQQHYAQIASEIWELWKLRNPQGKG